MTTMIIFLFLLFPTIVYSYTDQAINLLVRPISTSDVRRYCVELATLPNGYFVNITTFGWHLPHLVSRSINACNSSNLNTSLPSSFPSKTMLILYEHECTMTEHAWNVQRKFGQDISLMVITNRTNTHFTLTYDTTTMPVSIPVLTFLEDDFDKMIKTYKDLNTIELSIADPPEATRKFRPAILLMFLLVFIVLICGNFWAADEFKNQINNRKLGTNSQSSPPRQKRIMTKRNSITPSENSQTTEPAVMPMTCCVIIIMICFAVGWLLLLYYFPNVMIRILQVIFCIGAFSCLTTCFSRLTYFVPTLRRYRTPSYTFHKPCVCKLGPLNLITVFIMCISLTLVVIWYVYRQTDWAWILQDILGVALCVTVISTYRLGNMRVITIILVAFFLYDIFFVFITPYIPIFQQSSTSNSSETTTGSSSDSTSGRQTSASRAPSVMEQVALGIGTNGEAVPLLFALPMFIPESEINPCVTVTKSMLGFGDVILPGIVLTFCKIFDIASKNRWPIYYIQSVISYFVGLTITYVALYFMNRAQPALLYLVPCLLISTIITGLCRRELKEIYTGKRIETILQKATLPLHNGIDNPIGQQINGERPRDDIIVVHINDPVRF